MELHRRRRVRLVGMGAITALIATLSAALVIDSGEDEPSVAGATGRGWVARPTTSFTSIPFVSGYGVQVGIDATFDQTRILTAGHVAGVTAGGGDVEFYPRDGTDNDFGYPVPLTVPEGITVIVQSTIWPDCAVRPTTTPRFVVDSRDSHGSRHRNTAPVTSPTSWRAVVTRWCASGVHVHLLRSTTRVNGDQVRVLTIINPGPDPVTVTSVGTRHPRRGWARAQVEVPPAAKKALTQRGTGTRGLRRPTLLANGRPLRHYPAKAEDSARLDDCAFGHGRRHHHGILTTSGSCRAARPRPGGGGRQGRE